MSKHEGKGKRKSGRYKTRRSSDAAVEISVDGPIPALRGVQVAQVRMGPEDAADTGFELRDPEDFAPAPALLTPAAFALATLFDGERTAEDVAKEFEQRYEQFPPPEQVLNLAKQLDEALYLDSPRFQQRMRTALLSYLDSPSRPMVHAGTSYPKDPDELRERIAGYFTAPQGPGKIPDGPPTKNDLRALMVPHIELNVGGPTCAHGYKQLLERSQADLIVVLGVAHKGPSQPLFHISKKEFETPLGNVKVERGLAERLQEAVGGEPQVMEIAHRTEFSVEFQALFLQTLLKDRQKRDFEIVPVVCGAVEPYLDSEEEPTECESFQRFANALGEELSKTSRKWCVIASVDLSHVGPKFDHSTSIDHKVLLPIERGDKRLLGALQSLDRKAFFNEVQRTKNARNWDGVLALLAMLTAANGNLKSAELLRYEQWLEAPTKSAVTFASMAFRG